MMCFGAALSSLVAILRMPSLWTIDFLKAYLLVNPAICLMYFSNEKFSYMFLNKNRYFFNKPHLFNITATSLKWWHIIADMYVEGRVVHIF
jgi:hypothetical protein